VTDSTRDLLAFVDEWSPDVSLVLDGGGVVLHASTSVRRLTGWEPAHLVGRSGLELVHEDDVEYAIGSLFEAADYPGEHGGIELRLLRRDGSWMHAAVESHNPSDDADGRIVLTLRDVAEKSALPERRRRLEQAVLHVGAECAGTSADHLDVVLEAVLASLGQTIEADEVVLTSVSIDRDDLAAWGWSKDPSHRWNPGFPLDVAGLEAAASAVLRPSSLRVELGADLCGRVEQPIHQDGQLAGMLTIGWHTPDARRYWDEGNAKLLEAVARILVLTANRVQREGVLAHQALHDPLTGLANRANLLAALEHELMRGSGRNDTGLTLAFCDLNRFKEVNDTYGHAAGDALLRQVADVLRDSVRRGDLVARVGGDEFVVLCPEMTMRSSAEALVARVRTGLLHPVQVAPDVAVTATAAIGVVILDDLDLDLGLHDAAAVLEMADAAMYAAKSSGRGSDGDRMPHTSVRFAEIALAGTR